MVSSLNLKSTELFDPLHNMADSSTSQNPSPADYDVPMDSKDPIVSVKRIGLHKAFAITESGIPCKFIENALCEGTGMDKSVDRLAQTSVHTSRMAPRQPGRRSSCHPTARSQPPLANSFTSFVITRPRASLFTGASRRPMLRAATWKATSIRSRGMPNSWITDQIRFVHYDPGLAIR